MTGPALVNRYLNSFPPPTPKIPPLDARHRFAERPKILPFGYGRAILDGRAVP